ncbi:acetolactate synthase [Klebsiella oxytoca]|nr:acetolactate synthase [Klebsiella oxytoca]
MEVTASDALAEVVSNAFRAAEQGRPGSAFVSLPQDVVDEPVHARVLPASEAPQTGAAPDDAIERVAKMIAGAKNPVFLLGLMASQTENSAALRELLKKSHIPVTSTYQAAGAVNQDHFTRFAGRVGLFNNQAGDRLLHLADLVICIGYSPVEYEPAMWNNGNAALVHIDVLPAYEERKLYPGYRAGRRYRCHAAQNSPGVLTTSWFCRRRPRRFLLTASTSGNCSIAAARS